MVISAQQAPYLLKVNLVVAQSRGKRSSKSKNNAFDIEAVGLVFLIIGSFLLAMLVPQFPSGDWGERVRNIFLGNIGWGSYFLPWPLIYYGGLLLIGRNPKQMIKRSLAYFTTAYGLWCVLMLARPALTGAVGEDLKASLTGVIGWLAYLPALFIISLGLDAFRNSPLGFSARELLRKTIRGTQDATEAALLERKKLKERAALSADISNARTSLNAIDEDLKALNHMYAGNGELGTWRAEISLHLKNLKKLDQLKLKDAQTDMKRWKTNIASFTRDRAEDLKTILNTEGITIFHTWSSDIDDTLKEAVSPNCKTAKPLDTIRQVLAVDALGLAERYKHLCKTRDKTVAEIKSLNARQLLKAHEAHKERLKSYSQLSTAMNRLEKESNLLEPWRIFVSTLEQKLVQYPDAEQFKDLDSLAAKELTKLGRKALLEYEGWDSALISAEKDVLDNLPNAINLNDSWERSDSFDFQAESRAGHAFEKLNLDAFEDAQAESWSTNEADTSKMPTTNVPFLQQPLPDVSGVSPLSRYAEQEKLFAYAAEKAHYAVEEFKLLNDDEPAEVGGIPIQLPSFDLLDEISVTQENPETLRAEVRARVRKIDETLANFKLEGRVVSSVRGPTVTRFEVEPAPGEKISRFANLSDDLALAMAVGSVRIEAPIPGKSVIGLEVPNERRDLIQFREAVGSDAFRKSKARLPILLGKSIDGEMKVGDLAKMPHLLIAGSTGSGKSVAVNTIVSSLLFKFLPTELRFLMIDPKMVELTPYDGIPHLLQPVVTNPNDAAGVLMGAVAHMERRYKMMSKIGAKTIDQYNEKARNLDMSELPVIVIIIDELADLMITSKNEVESAIMRLAQMARATGMHLILATQRPSVDILTSLIKVNVPARVAFAVSSGHDSRTILDSMGAERLIGSGDMLMSQPGMVKPQRLQGPYINEATELVNVPNFLRRQFFEDEFVEAYGSDFDPPSIDDSDANGYVDWNDEKLKVAAELVINEGQASVSRLQRRLQIGHARAGKLMDSLEALAVVGPHQGSKPREVLVEMTELPNIFGS